MYKLICFLNLFLMDQTIFIVNEEDNSSKVAASATFDTLAEKLADLSHITNINSIQLRGGSKEYANEIANEVLTYAKIKYGINDLDVEVY